LTVKRSHGGVILARLRGFSKNANTSAMGRVERSSHVSRYVATLYGLSICN